MSTDVERQQEAPASDKVWSIETNGINPIPESERHGKPFDMFWIWCAANIGILGISYGTYLVSFYSLNFPQSIAAGILGTVISFLLVGGISLAGMLGSAPTLVLSRAAFGVVGNAITTAISYISLVGWETVLVALATFAAEAVLDRLGVPPGKPTLAISFVIIAAITIAIGLLGHATILKIATWFTYAFAVLTVLFVILEWSHLDWSKVSSLPSGTGLNFIGGMSVIMAGLGIGWVNAGADYSRYLPRSSNRSAIVGWTTFGASIAPILLIIFGALLAANHPDLASSANPIGDLGQDMPTWFLVPYLLAAVGGLVAGAMLDIYSSGLNLLTLGVKLPRYQSVVIDGTLMVIGNIYILFIAAGLHRTVHRVPGHARRAAGRVVGDLPGGHADVPAEVRLRRAGAVLVGREVRRGELGRRRLVPRRGLRRARPGDVHGVGVQLDRVPDRPAVLRDARTTAGRSRTRWPARASAC